MASTADPGLFLRLQAILTLHVHKVVTAGEKAEQTRSQQLAVPASESIEFERSLDSLGFS